MKNKKRRAFTLTELLIVVIIIGVLSAVVLPKFNKIIETRKTTEAEEMMAAVRTEQEQRCSLNKQYTDSFAKLTNVISSNTTKNYQYGLTRDGVTATSKGSYHYDLKMPSYADGRICCDTDAPGNQCDKLNKDYPSCNELIARADYMATEQECRVPCNPPNGNSYTEPCGAGYNGTRTFTWSNDSCSYNETGNTCTCAPTHNGQTTYTEGCGAGYSGTITYTWNSSSCSYSQTGNTCQCTPTHNGQSTYTGSCPSGQTGTITYTWDSVNCIYTNNSATACTVCTPTHNGQNSYTDCPSGKTGRTCTWNTSTCEYNCTGTCSCTATATHGNSYNPCPSGQGGRRCTWNAESCQYNCSGECTAWRCWYCDPCQQVDPHPKYSYYRDTDGYQFSFYYTTHYIDTCIKSQTTPTSCPCGVRAVGYIHSGSCYDAYPQLCPATIHVN